MDFSIFSTKVCEKLSTDTLDKVLADWTMSTESMGSLESGHCPWTQWKVWTLSTDTLDKVLADWTMSTESMGSLDIVHGLSGKCGHCPCGHYPLIPWTKSRQTGQCPLNPWALWSLDIVHRLSGKCGHCPLNPWALWTLSMDSVESVDIVH